MAEKETGNLPIIYAHRVGCGCEGWRCYECWKPLARMEQIVSIGTTRYCLDCVRFLIQLAHEKEGILVAKQKH